MAEAEGEDDDASDARREVVVPLRLYKTVTVFSTLIAVVAVVAGFLALDEATQRAQRSIAEIDPVVAAIGLLLIAFGAAVYVYGSRFRAPGMGTTKSGDPKDGGDG